MLRRHPATGQYLSFDWWSHAVALDAHGCAFESSDHQIHWDRSSSSGRPLPSPPPNVRFAAAHGSLKSFPRREKNFKLRFFNHQGKAVAEFEVPNPEYRFYPAWRPNPVGATSQDHELSVTLTGLTNRLVVIDQDQRDIAEDAAPDVVALGIDLDGLDDIDRAIGVERDGRGE